MPKGYLKDAPTPARSPSGRGRSVIITGGAGFVGKYLIAELAKSWPDKKIVVWDLPEVDITRPESYRESLKSEQPEWLIHLAALSSVPKAVADPDLAHEVNYVATEKLLEEVDKHSPATKIFVTSTADIYGSTMLTASGLPIAELPLAEAKAQNPYSASKLEMEQMIENKWADRVMRVRPFPHIGAGQGLGFVTADFASQVAAIEARQIGGQASQEPVIKVGNLKAERDFTHVKDVVRAYRLLMEQGKLGEVYHVASGEPVLISEVLDKLIGLANVEVRVEQDAARMRPVDVPRIVGDATKLRELTGWEPQIGLDESLSEILNSWREKVESVAV